MPIEVRCPNPKCSRLHFVKSRWAGKRGTCPVCGTLIDVPLAQVPLPQGDVLHLDSIPQLQEPYTEVQAVDEWTEHERRTSAKARREQIESPPAIELSSQAPRPQDETIELEPVPAILQWEAIEEEEEVAEAIVVEEEEPAEAIILDDEIVEARLAEPAAPEAVLNLQPVDTAQVSQPVPVEAPKQVQSEPMWPRMQLDDDEGSPPPSTGHS